MYRIVKNPAVIFIFSKVAVSFWTVVTAGKFQAATATSRFFSQCRHQRNSCYVRSSIALNGLQQKSERFFCDCARARQNLNGPGVRYFSPWFRGALAFRRWLLICSQAIRVLVGCEMSHSSGLVDKSRRAYIYLSIYLPVYLRASMIVAHSFTSIYPTFFYFILLIHEGSHREVYQEFQPSYDIFHRCRQGLFRPQVPCTPCLHCPIANSASAQSQQPV